MARASQSQTLVKLDFKEAIFSKGSKRDASEVVLKRIKILRQKLSVLEQDAVDLRSLDPIRKQLIHQDILIHKDRGVKAYAACCMADMLRLYAPDAPYSESQLSLIFGFFIAQITDNLKVTTASTQPLQVNRNKSNGAKEPPQQSQTQQSQRVTDVAYYTEYYQLIESLATIKSVVLVCDVPDSEVLMEKFFTGFMEIIRPDMNKTLIRYLRDILVALIEESSQLPQKVMDCLINQFERFSSYPETLSFQLTVDVCNQVADKLKRPIYAHFSDIQATHGRDPTPNDLKILSESHDLLLAIYRVCPDLLLNVVPLLEENLKVADEVTIRQLSVKTLGQLFSQHPGAEHPARKYPSAWSAWLGRRVDKALPVRLAWVESTKDVLVNHPEVRKELQANLMDRADDSDERIRAAICKVIGSLDYETALHHVSSDTLQTIGARMGDKKSSVRLEAVDALAKLWNLAYSEIESNNPDAIKQFAWIPDTMLSTTSRGGSNPELRSQLLSMFKSSIIPLPKETNDEQAWVDRLLLVTSRLSEISLKALKKMTGLTEYAQGMSPFMALVQSCEEYNGGVIADGGQDAKAKLNFIIDAMSRMFFGDADKAKRDLHAFAAANETRLFKLYKTCVDIHSSLPSIVKAKNEFLRRVHQGHDDLLETLTTLVDVSAWNVVNQSSIPALLRRISKPESEASASAAAKLLGMMAKEGAPMFKSHTGQLVVSMMDKKNEKLVELSLQALASVCKIYPDVAPAEHRPVERAIAIALEGTPRQAKFAARFLARCKEPEACDDLIRDIVKGFKKLTGTRILTYLRALTELALVKPQAFEAQSEDIMKFVMNEVILSPSPSSDVDGGDEWVEEDTLETLDRAKILALRLLTHRCIGFAREPEADQILKPILKLLCTVLQNDGMINESTGEGGFARCHLRLRASMCQLKLANVKAFDRAITIPNQFEMIVGTIQDPCYMVRNLFLRKLGQILPTQRLLPRWNIAPIMVAMDPEAENVAAGRAVMAAIIGACANFSQSERIERIEMPLARLLHLLAHHPDLHWNEPEEGEEGEEGISDQQNLKDIAKFIELYLDCVANRDNIGLLHHIAQQLKGVRDRHGDNSRPLWTLAELTELIIRNRATKHAWSIPTYPGKIRFPKDIFHHADNPEDRQKVQRTQYLSEEVRDWAKGLGKRNTVSQPTKRAEPHTSTSPGIKRKSSTKKRTSRKKRRIEQSDDENDNDSDDDEDDEDESETVAESVEDDIEEGEAVLGRGGRRGAKTKAKRAVGKKGKKVRSKKDDEDEEMGQESDLTDLDD
ncbi:uncharacterized protein IL334_001683 [Kwoniella shivajii]|uniref:Sister chromatid cohesion protein PDS5 n=1 Tax=Kwoniella shivajii TaxID=564305 RepID=A0ABZ1CSL5_9TREE|nr:hypothetical protein IL334_001683 [Kwoniella shivajii]